MRVVSSYDSDYMHLELASFLDDTVVYSQECHSAAVES